MRLGKIQKHVLEGLAEYGSWCESSGWVWDNNYTTRNVLNALVKKGLVKHIPSSSLGGRWVINEAGEKLLGDLR